MTTSSLLSQLTASANQSMSSLSLTSSTSSAGQHTRTQEAPFSQFLSHEIAGRQRTNVQTEKMATPVKPAKSAAPSAPSATKPSASPSANTSQAPATQASAKVANKEGGEESQADARQTDGLSKDDEQIANAAASADLLAMMAGMAQLASQAKAGEATVQGEATMQDAGLAVTDAGIGARKIVPQDEGDAQFDLADTASALKAAKQARLSDSAQTDQNADRLPGDTTALAADKGKDVSSQVKGDFAQNLQSRIDTAISKGPATTVTTSVTTPVALAQAQNALIQNAAAPSPANEKLSPKVGTAAWDQALGQRVVWMVAGGEQSASLTLNPPDLGPLQVVLNVTNAHADATFIAAQPEVRAALEAALPKLRDMLGEAGIQLGQASVNAGTPNQNSASSQTQSGSGSRNMQADKGLTEQPTRPLTARVSVSGNGLVDTFA